MGETHRHERARVDRGGPALRADGPLRDSPVHPLIADERHAHAFGGSLETPATMTKSFLLLAPSLVLSAAAFLLFALDGVSAGGKAGVKSASFWLTLLGLLAAMALVPGVGLDVPVIYGRGMLVADGLSFALTWIALLTVFLVVVLSVYDRTFAGMSLSVYYGLL